MEGGRGSQSYASNSSLQSHAFQTLAKPLLSNAIANALEEYSSSYTNATINAPHQRHQLPFTVADLGCSHGPNAIQWFSFIASNLRRSLAMADHLHDARPPFDLFYFFSDLPSNDFNSLFHTYSTKQSHDQEMQLEGTGDQSIAMKDIELKVFAAGVPGSFYSRLFPSGTLHLVVCSFALHWLSKVPSEVLDPTSNGWNGGNVWLHPSRPQVMALFEQQWQQDMAMFLRCRAEEIASGGVLFLFMLTRGGEEQDFLNLENSIWMSHFQDTWDELVTKGVITTQERDTFNVPIYKFHPNELIRALTSFSNEFELLHMVKIDNYSKPHDDDVEHLCNDPQVFGKFYTNFVASLAKPMLEKHLGNLRAQRFLDHVQQVATRNASRKISMFDDLLVTILRRR